MNITQVGNRGILFTFDELNKPPYDCLTNVYVIIGNRNFFVCDTYLGKYYISGIKEYLENNYGKKKYIVFNSHSHWDHIWGNSAFDKHLIISHKKCRDFIELHGIEEVEENANLFARDEINIILPNLTFDNNISFDEEGIEFFYSPGHSEDSSSCYDKVDNTLFVGDNVDDPIPSYMCWDNLDMYLGTLNNYLTFDADRIVQSHGPVIDNNVIKENIEYILKLKRNEKIEYESTEILKKHYYNLEFFESQIDSEKVERELLEGNYNKLVKKVSGMGG